MKPSHGTQPLARLPEAERGGVEGEVLAAYDRSVALLADLGADVVERGGPALSASWGR